MLIDLQFGRVAAQRLIVGLAAALLIGQGSTPARAQSNPPALTSAAIDATIYRDGEVRRFSIEHENWRIVCDEIARLKQRFCSLRSLVLGADGGIAAELTVSTGQDGRPAALLKMAEAAVAGGLEIVALRTATPAAKPTTTPAAKGAAKAAPPGDTTRLKPVVCAERVCTLVWTLKPDQIGALNDGRGLKLIATAPVEFSSLANLQPPKPARTFLDVRSAGFKEAVAVSVRPFEPQ